MNTASNISSPALTPNQDAVIAYLESQVATSSDHIRTHCAHIFLIDDAAYKLKSAIKYSYLDMSTLEKRKKLIEREYELNAAVLPDIYEGVVPITFDEKRQLHIGGSGTVVEWVLKMRRFCEDSVLDKIAVRGDLNVLVAKKMGQSLAEYHANLPSLPVTDGYMRIKEVYDELVDELGLLSHVFSVEQLDRFKRQVNQVLEQTYLKLDQRAADGFVKRCHGDLHLRNILMTSAGPTPFDALEFDERMATTDVLYDMSFLLMDMLHRGMPRQTNALMNSYLLYSVPKQCEGLRHLPLFLCIRAAIRAMTTAQAAGQSAADTQSLYDQARQYLVEANTYLQERAPRLIAVGGFSGTGKSSVANAIATRVHSDTGAVLLRSDSERKVLAGVDEIEKLPETHYTNENSKMVYEHLFTKARMALEAGSTVILDAVFHDSELRVQAQKIAQEANLPFTGLWLEAPVAVLEARLNGRHNDASDADVTVLKKQLLKATGFLKWTHVDASGSLERTIEIVVDELELADVKD